MKKAIIAVSIIVMIFAAGCADNKKEDTATYTEGPLIKTTSSFVVNCEKICQQKLKENPSLSNGPCLSNEIAPDWVCDVAHNPREAVDDLPENQCLMYRGGEAHHFVEVDEDCNIIRAV